MRVKDFPLPLVNELRQEERKTKDLECFQLHSPCFQQLWFYFYVLGSGVRADHRLRNNGKSTAL